MNGEQTEGIPSINPVRKGNDGSHKKRTDSRLSLRLLFLIGIALVAVFVSQAFYHYPTEDEKIELENLENRITQHVPLKDWEKSRFCDLLAKVKGIELSACKGNYFCHVGGLTGYKITQYDVDLRGTGTSFVDAIVLAFKLTGVSLELFEEVEWARDLNGKLGIVRWKGPGNAEVNVDAPHTYDGPNVFHIGYKMPGKKDQITGHIFLDCVPYFRKVK